MSKANKQAIRIVESGNSEGNRATPPSLAGVRQLPDGSLEYRADASDGSARWLPLSSPIRVLALTRDGDNRNWGRLIEVVDADGRSHRWSMPVALLASVRGDDYRQTLLSLGARLAHGSAAAHALHRYLSAIVDFEGHTLPRARAATRLGWHDDCFVLPDRALGGSDLVVYQTNSEIRAAVRAKGSLGEWRERVAKPAEGNPRVVLALSAAFAAPLLGPLQLEGAGFHFRGGSSIGKTTTLVAAGSVWGGPRDHGGLNGYKQSWQATANAIEGLAQAHCDLPLCLDELSLVRGEDAARVGYQLASGLGRGRAFTSGLPAARLEWRVFLISTGEISLADKIADARTPQRHMPGQAVRFIDLAADAGTGYGLFDHAPALAEKPNGGTAKDRGDALARNLLDAAQSCFGTAGPAFVEAFIADREASLVEARRLVNLFAVQHAAGADGQVQRVARTFGLPAAAGELAIAYGVLPWPSGEPVRAASRCFADWLADRGGAGAAEIDGAISYLRATIERDGASRFQRSGSSEVVHQRLGFIRETHDDTEYMIPHESWKALMVGRDARRIARELADRGILKRDSEGRPDPKERVPGHKNAQRVFVVRHSALFADGGEDA
jgi:putative DNA primase/helicase